MFRHRRRTAARRAAIRSVQLLEARALLTLTVPIYHSNSAAAAKIYLDFDGHDQGNWGDFFNNVISPIYNTDDNSSDYSTAEIGEMLSIARRVGEDFAPFNLDVTTELPADQSHGNMLRVVVGGSQADWYGIQANRSVSGIAYIDSFTQTVVPNVVYTFINQQGVFFPDTQLARVVSHEAGHGFGLQHQSDWNSDHQLVAEYSNGNGNGMWTPIMGSLQSTINTWHNGTSVLGWDQLQDDMAIIANPQNGFGYRADDFGNTGPTATALTITSNRFSVSGVIAQNNDVDVFSFTTPGGATLLRVNPSPWDPNLVPVLELYNSSGTLLTSTTAMPDQPRPAFINTSLAADTYYVAVKSDGQYGHVGQYTLSGNLAAGTNIAPVVDAGPIQSIPQSAYVLLHGSYVDDGLPIPPKNVTTTWTKRSGPGTVTFWSTSSAETVASFSAAGTYVLRLTANDGNRSANDEVAITVTAALPTNHNPSVDAGPDRTIVISGSAALDGTVSDDNLPNPPANLTTHWELAAGPGNVTFANAAAVDTTATFTQTGTYHLRLVATDGQATHFDQMIVTVNSSGPANVAPGVDAGQDQQTDIQYAVSILATITDDGLPNPPGQTTTTWSKVSGPGTVTFGDPSLNNTTAIFSQTGTYVLRATVTDGELSSFDELTVIVTPAVGSTTTINLQEGVGGYAGMTDATLKSTSPTSKNGGASTLDVHGNPDKSSILRWSLPSLPSGSTVQSASITLHVTNETNSLFQVYEVLKSWSEADVTWNNAANGIAWKSPGAQANGLPADNDRGTAILGELTSNGLDGFVTIGLNSAGVALVQKWINTPASNHGIIIQNYADSAGDGVTFDSSESASSGFRPKLTILYSSGSASTNQPPTVDAGANQTITLGNPASLNGTVTDDSLPNPPATVATIWSKTSGPGTVTFANSSAIDTTATFSIAGTYVLRLTANDGLLAAFDEVTVVVSAGGVTTALNLQEGVDGYAGAIDATLKGGSVTSNSGAAPSLDAHGNPDKAAILRWALPTVPAGSTVQSASITLHVTNETNSVFELYEVLKTWTENGVTWTDAAIGVPWRSPGAQFVGDDRAGAILGELTSNGLEGFVTINLNPVGVALIQKWIDNPSTNHGIIIQDYADSTSDGVSFDSSEATTASFRPKLTIVLGPAASVSPSAAAVPEHSATSDPTTATGSTTAKINCGCPICTGLAYTQAIAPSNSSARLTPVAAAAFLADVEQAEIALDPPRSQSNSLSLDKLFAALPEL